MEFTGVRQFIHQLIGLVSSKIVDDSTNLVGLLQGLNEILDIKHLAQCQDLNTHTLLLGIFKLQTQRVVDIK